MVVLFVVEVQIEVLVLLIGLDAEVEKCWSEELGSFVVMELWESEVGSVIEASSKEGRRSILKA